MVHGVLCLKVVVSPCRWGSVVGEVHAHGSVPLVADTWDHIELRKALAVKEDILDASDTPDEVGMSGHDVVHVLGQCLVG